MVDKRYSLGAKLVMVLSGAAMMTLGTLPSSADQGENAGSIEVKSGLLSVHLEKVAISEVLRTVGEQAGVRVRIQGNPGNVQPQVFWRVPLPEGINLLMKNSNADWVMMYNRGEAGHRYLKEIRVYEGSRNNHASPPAPPHIPAPEPPLLPIPSCSP